jgi:hypothetical protein
MKIGSYVTRYRITIHEHNIYDHWVEAPSKNEAIAIAEEAISDGNDSKWELDQMACWTDIGDIYNEAGEEI